MKKNEQRRGVKSDMEGAILDWRVREDLLEEGHMHRALHEISQMRLCWKE